MLVDYHMHLENGPKTLEYVEEFVQVAKKRGISEIGFSEHCYRFKEAIHLLDNNWTRKRNVDSIEEYLNLLQSAKDHGFAVKAGIEVDYIPENEALIRDFLREYKFDYVLGSIHWLDEFGFDLKENLPIWEKSDIDQLWRQYFQTLLLAAESKLFDSLPHPDLIKIFNFYPKNDLSEFIADILSKIAETGVALEVSTAGWRKPVGQMYPSKEILLMIKKYDIPVTLASDAHYPSDVGKDFEKMIGVLQSVGIKEYVRFSQREKIIEKL